MRVNVFEGHGVGGKRIAYNVPLDSLYPNAPEDIALIAAEVAAKGYAKVGGGTSPKMLIKTFRPDTPQVGWTGVMMRPTVTGR
jgi:hypothetical protein